MARVVQGPPHAHGDVGRLGQRPRHQRPARDRRQGARARCRAARSSTCTTGSTARRPRTAPVVVAALPLILDGLRARQPAAGAPRPARRRSRVPVLRPTPQLTACACTPTTAEPDRRRRRAAPVARRLLVAGVGRRARALPPRTRSCCRPTASTTTCTSGTSRDDLWHHGRLPWRMPVLAHGDAYAYPYGFVNWTTAALVWPLFGNWAVTLWTALGAVGCIVATFVAFPELRRGWWAAAVLANPAILEALLFGQQSFAWGAMLLLFGIAAWRRGHRAWAAVLVGLAQANHAAIVLPIGVLRRARLPAVHATIGGRSSAGTRCRARWRCPRSGSCFASPTTGQTQHRRSRSSTSSITLGPRDHHRRAADDLRAAAPHGAARARARRRRARARRVISASRSR